ncbi:unnamed protein product, partial [Polarella glacialis]
VPVGTFRGRGEKQEGAAEVPAEIVIEVGEEEDEEATASRSAPAVAVEEEEHTFHQEVYYPGALVELHSEA